MKYRILEILEKNADSFTSGEFISSELNVTRTTVWKYIKELKNEGYIIESSSKKGYSLTAIPDILNEHEIGNNLPTDLLGKEIYYLKTIDSTNNFSKKIANEGCKDGTLVVADTQTLGKGRIGRSWESKSDKGIWMSIILKPRILPSHIQIITLAASIAVVEGIKKATGLETGIKWPNDIILDGKKVCGILTEMSSELDRINYIILGIGINVNHSIDDFSYELRNKATSLKIQKNMKYMEDIIDKENWKENHQDIKRSSIIKAILIKLEELYKNIIDGKSEVVIEQWKRASMTLGKEVRILSESSEYIGLALDVTDDGGLVVKDSNGIVHKLISGEISIRGMEGYAL